MSLDAVFLDREGVITPKLAPGEYLLQMDQVALATGVPEALTKLLSQGVKLFIVSNQSCVGRGMISMEEAQAIHDEVLKRLNEQGVTIMDSRLCPHVDEDHCACRKPKAGMILDLCAQYGIRPERAAMIGDSRTDIQAGEVAGCATSILLSENGPSSLDEAVDGIMECVNV
ncbi:MAG: HAD-IIIA family hydrolase [Patescibacteria group bacterium]